jgi:drug/metabolite transporter (DMT)-like permease
MRLSPSRLQAYLYLLLNTLLWGAALIIVKPAFDTTTPFRFLFYRFLLASVLCIPILVHFYKKGLISFKVIRTVTLVELIGTTLNLGLLYLGVARTSAIEASLITTTAPIFTILLGIFLLKERQEKREWLGLVLSFGGMILLTLLPALTHGAISYHLSLLGNLLIIGANIAESTYYITAKKAYKKLPKLMIASIGFVVGAISFGFLSLWEVGWSTTTLITDARVELSTVNVLIPVVYMAVFGSIIALTAYIKGQDIIEASEASLFRYLQPAVYLPLGVIFLKEPVYPLQLVGLVLILLGVFVAQLKKGRRG